MLSKLFIFAIISSSIVLTPVAQAAEVMTAGSVLEEDSIVFSLEDGKELKERIEALEITEAKAESLEELVVVQEKQILTLEGLLENKSAQIDEWSELSNLHRDRVESLERRESLNNIENIGWFILGVALTGGAIYMGDKIGDTMETN